MVTFLRTEVICYNRMEGCLPSAPKCSMNFTLFVMGIVGGEINIASPSRSCFLHSLNCIACQWKWNRCKDMAFTDWMNFVSNRARGPLYLILSMTHFFLPSFPQYLKVYRLLPLVPHYLLTPIYFRILLYNGFL